ncbi:Nramp family divalent metal transporter [Sporolactobacillus shoreicorticis]|uniref:Divalent metal cation transporter MntH n=1 Tax=Sporolactobacillus shoreicorticis TaxID=1923877 RepID=A0ABW5RZY7_9BACL|nr:Nramp family divalent metal transporter [Sporolactobacillus shoreicorticis]MCO7124972.1 Nramp family divalent metal transporter [Sporolactobacillus shoreicorticis]
MNKRQSSSSVSSEPHPQSYDQAVGGVKGWRQMLPFIGPAFIAAVAYIDPGNYATNIQAGSQFGYLLLWVVVASNLMAILIQTLSAKIGIATSHNLPEIIRDRWPRKVSIFYWIQGEIMIMATDLAEFIGAALGFHLVFGLPMIPSAILTAICALLILTFQVRGFRPLEMVIALMVFIVVIAFSLEIFFALPEFKPFVQGFVPQFQGTDSVLLAAGILGATVMPHAIYMHSGLTCRRVIGRNAEERKKIFRFELIDILIAMVIAGVINAIMLAVAGSTFFGKEVIDDLTVAFHGFSNYIAPIAGVLFGVGLLSAGLSSSSVGTLAGDIMMQGFIHKRIPVFLRRVCSMLPPLILILSGANATKALVMSQVVLSFGIALAIIPLIVFTSNKALMDKLVNHKLTTVTAWCIAVVVIFLNLFLLYQTFFG